VSIGRLASQPQQALSRVTSVWTRPPIARSMNFWSSGSLQRRRAGAPSEGASVTCARRVHASATSVCGYRPTLAEALGRHKVELRLHLECEDPLPILAMQIVDANRRNRTAKD
jgi:hypothetical protein